MNSEMKYMGDYPLLSEIKIKIVCVPVGYILRHKLLSMDAEVYLSSLACMLASESIRINVSPPIYVYPNTDEKILRTLLKDVYIFYENAGFIPFFYRIKIIEKSIREAVKHFSFYEEDLGKYGDSTVTALSLLYDLKSRIYSKYNMEELMPDIFDTLKLRRKIWAKIISNLKLYVKKIEKLE